MFKNQILSKKLARAIKNEELYNVGGAVTYYTLKGGTCRTDGSGDDGTYLSDFYDP